MQNYGYYFYFVYSTYVIPLPITPGELNITVGSNNKVVTLINEGDVNILKSPALTEVSFDARFPMRKYPYSREAWNVSQYETWSFQKYFDRFKDIKENKRSFRFMVVRNDGKGNVTWDTNMLVALESMDIKESADQGDDVIISFKLKQYKEYGIQKISINQSSSNTTSTSSGNRDQSKAPDKQTSKTHVIQSGDTLWSIAKKYYGDGAKHSLIYKTNMSVIEATAKAHGYASSSGGSRIWPGTKLIIPSAG